jgi:predicted phosphodiesterase
LAELPPADVFLHAGDLTQYGTKEELESVIEWIASLPYKHKVVIAGNHDIGLDKDCTHRSGLARRAGSYATIEETEILIKSMKERNIIYLSPEQPSTEIFIDGCCLRIYGLPYSPLSIGPSAFMRPKVNSAWTVEGKFDILLSHSPPRGHLDQNKVGDSVGCDMFRSAIERIRPCVAVFGHIHEARGMDTLTWKDGTSTTLYNAAMKHKDGTLSAPTVFNITIKECKNVK